MKYFGIRSRIIILVVLAALPTLAVTLYGAWDERVRAVAGARKDMRSLAKLAAQQQAQIIEGAKQALVAISLIPPAVRNDSASCNAFLATLLAKSAGLYHSIGIYGEDGFLQCNAIPWQGTIQSSGRRYVSLALSTGKFTIGEYQIGRVTKQQGINLGYPITDTTGRVTGVAFIALDLGGLNSMAATVPLPEQGVLVVVDQSGILIAHSPEKAGRIGSALPNPDILKAVLAAREGELNARGYDGLVRFVAFNTVAVNPDGAVAMRVAVSVPSTVVLADVNAALMRDLVGVLAATMLLLIGAWYGAEVFVLRSLRSLLEFERRVEAGDLAARTGLAGGKDELAQIGRAFDRMASALEARDADLQLALRNVEQQATTDPLTGLHNRRFLYDALPRELMRAQRKAAPVAVMMIDIDHFKSVNDTYGHAAGDRVLKDVARLIDDAVRPSDISCRYGGEEMLLVLPETTLEDARVRAENIRAAVENLDVDCPEATCVRVTISLGVAVFPEHGGDAETLVQAADQAMYEAKEAGRNRVHVARIGSPNATVT